MGVLSRTPAPIDCDRPASADFLRVLAAWAVGAFHIWQQSWYSRPAAEHWLRAGSVGVDFLVMLSAFCLFLPWANAAAQDRPLPQTRPAEFYRRRAVRLLPAYYASLLFSLALAVYRSGWSRALAVDLFTHLTLTQQLFPACYIGTQLNAVSWTLTVFALFYLVFPLLAPLCARHPLPVLGALCGVQLVYSLWALPQYGGYAYPRLFNQFPAFCGVLAVGMAAALVFARLARGGWTQHFLLRAGCAVLGRGGACPAHCPDARAGCGSRLPALSACEPYAAGHCGGSGRGRFLFGADAARPGAAAAARAGGADFQLLPLASDADSLFEV